MTLPLTDVAKSDQPQSLTAEIKRVESGQVTNYRDTIAVEEPLEIILNHGDMQQTVSITMRTPGNDFELVLGFLFAEGVIRSYADVVSIDYWGPRVGHLNLYNTVIVHLRNQPGTDLKRLERNFFTHSGCGICGKTALEALALAATPELSDQPIVTAKLLCQLPGKMNEFQKQFNHTGGLHAAALFNSAGDPLSVFEDVGRHNALDKLIGHQLARGDLPARQAIVVVSGRASFELVQKALMANIAVFVSVGAPSSLALDLAKEHDLTLVGFTNSESLNVYHGDKRIGHN